MKQFKITPSMALLTAGICAALFTPSPAQAELGLFIGKCVGYARGPNEDRAVKNYHDLMQANKRASSQCASAIADLRSTCSYPPQERATKHLSIITAKRQAAEKLCYKELGDALNNLLESSVKMVETLKLNPPHGTSCYEELKLNNQASSDDYNDKLRRLEAASTCR